MTDLDYAVKDILITLDESPKRYTYSNTQPFIVLFENEAKKLSANLKAAYLAESKQEPTDKLSKLAHDVGRLESIVYDATPQILDLQERVSVLEAQFRQLGEDIFIATRGKEL